MSRRFLDIDLILSEEERLPCVFQVDAANMGHFDSTVQEKDLPKNARVELPHWLGQKLQDKNMAKMELPKHFNTKMRDEMRAGAASVNLREFSHYFFEIGLRLSRSAVPPDADLQRTLRAAFLGERFRRLMVYGLDQAQG